MLNKAAEVTEENPLGSPAMAPDITRTDLVGRHQRRRFLMNHEASDREHVKRMQRLFEEGMSKLNKRYYFSKLVEIYLNRITLCSCFYKNVFYTMFIDFI